MAGAQSDAARKSYGPYDLLQDNILEGKVLVTLPYDNVKGSQILINVIDNLGVLQILVFDQRFWAAAEISIWGVIQGYASPIKTQWVRSITGPMEYIFPYEEAYDSVEVRGRNMTGGKSRSSPGTDLFVANGVNFLRANILINPRTGFDKGDGLIKQKPPMNWG